MTRKIIIIPIESGVTLLIQQIATMSFKEALNVYAKEMNKVLHQPAEVIIKQAQQN